MKKILLVDDDERILESFSRWLQNQGYKVETAENGQAALKKIDYSLPDLIISDMRMHPIDGVELMKKIPEGEDFFPGKIIFTAFDDNEAFQVANLGESGVFRVEKDRWETDLPVAIARALELHELKKKIWEQARLKAEMEKKIEKLKFAHTLAATIGHYVNNPLQSIQLANLNLAKLFGKQTSNQVIEDNVNRINEVVNKMRSLAKISEGEYAGKVKFLDLSGKEDL